MSATNGHVLGDVASFVRGITFTPEDLKPPFEEGTAVCMRTKNVQVNLDELDLIAVPKEFVRRKEQYLSEGDLLVSSANSWNLVGKCCWVPKLDYEATAGGFISILRADRKKVDPRYLYHWFAAPQTQHEVRLCGRQTTNISNLNYERCLNLPIPLPNLEEQKRIAAILDKADAIRRKRQEARFGTRDFMQSLFDSMFGQPLSNPHQWPVQALEDVIAEGTSVSYGIVQCGPEVKDGIPYIRTSDMTNEVLGPIGAFSRTAKEIAAKYQRSTVRTGDLVFANRASIGAIVEVPDYLDGANLTQGTTRIAPGPDVHRHYLMWLFRSAQMQQWLDRAAKGVTFREVTMGRLRETPIPVPPMEIQNEFSRRYEQALRLAEHWEIAEKEAKDLFNSLVQRAFKGEL